MTLFQIRVLSLGYEEVSKRMKSWHAKQMPEDIQERRRQALEFYASLGYDAR